MRRLLLAAVLALPLIAATPLIALAQDAPPAPPAPGSPDAPPDPTIGRPARPPMTPEMRSAIQAMRTACAADMARLCGDANTQSGAPAGDQAGAPPRRGGAMRCMIQHSTEISPGCEQAIGAVRALRRADHG